MSPRAALAPGVFVALAFAACGGSEQRRPQDTRDGDSAQDATDAADSDAAGDSDAAADADGSEPDGDVAPDAADVGPDASDAGDTAADTEPDAPSLPGPGTFVTGEAKLSEEYVFKSVWAGEPDRIVAVGNDGVIASQSPDGSWKTLELAQGVSLLNGIHGVDSDHLFAVGIDGAVLMGSVDNGFSKVDSGLATLFAVRATAQDRAFAVGRDGLIAYWDGQVWGPSTGADASAVWNGITAYQGTVALVGNSGQAVLSRGAGIEPVTTNVAANLHGVFTLDGSEFWAVGDQGVLLHGSDTTWTPSDKGLVVSLRDVHGDRSDDVYAVGYGGAILHWNGSGWDLLETPTASGLLGVWVASGGDVTIVGQDGLVFEGDAAQGFHQTDELELGGELDDVWATADGSFMVAVGAQGRIFAREDGAWSEMTSPTSQALASVWGTSATDVWAVGRSGVAIHWDGVAWTRFETPVTELIAAVWGDGESHYLAAGSGGTLLVWNGASWESVASATTNNLRALFDRDGVVWTVGAGAAILRYNGLGWGGTKVQGIPNADGGEDPITDELFAVWMASDEDGWAVGDNGRMLRWDGKMWNIVQTEFTVALRGIYGLAANDVWAVGTAGHILHWNGEAWEKVPTTTVATLYAIHGDGGKHVIAVGDLGTVLSLQRD